VQSFKHLGSFVDASWNLELHVQDEIGRAFKPLGLYVAQCFVTENLYCSMVLGVLLYRVESCPWKCIWCVHCSYGGNTLLLKNIDFLL